MSKRRKNHMSMETVPLNIGGENTQYNTTIFKSNNQIGILNAIFSCFIYLSISPIAVGAVGSEPTDSIIHWGNLVAFLLFAVLFFYTLRILSYFSCDIFENITIKNIALAIVCAIIVYSVNYNMNLLVWKNIFKTSYDELIFSFNSLRPIPVLIYACILGPIGEELLLRGYVLKGLRNKYTTVGALLISSLIFAVLHWNITQIINAFIMGIMFGIIYIKTNSIFSCMLAHIINNSIAMYVMTYPHTLPFL